MAADLSAGNFAIALLANAIATGAGLIVIIQMFGSISGAHFNPVVTMVIHLRGEMSGKDALAYVAVQFLGAMLGTWLVHAMFEQSLIQVSTNARDGIAMGLSELVATFGLIGTIIGTQQSRIEYTPVAVGLYIASAYWFTASTSFANPAVALARGFTDTFAGIAPPSIPLFIVAQILGAGMAWLVFRWLFVDPPTTVKG